MTGWVMEFSVLGPLEVYTERTVPRDGTALSPKLRDLLAVLLCRPNVMVRSEWLIDVMWTTAPRTADKTLQVYIHHLRRALGPERLVSRPCAYVLLLHSDEVDAQRFTARVQEGRRAIAAGQRERGAQVIKEAVALWRGPAYDGQDHIPPVREESVRLTELRLAATEERIDAELALGRHAELVGELHGLVAEHPFREGSRAQLMLALYRAGRVTEALETYHEGRRCLADEFGLDPGPALKDLEQAILNHDPALLDDRKGPRRVGQGPSARS